MSITFSSSEKVNAIATGFRQNCLFNCLAHVWLNLPDETLKKLNDAAKYPVYTKIIKKFCDYYGITEDLSFDDFMAMSKLFSNRYDREIVFGPILRQVLREEYYPDWATNSQYEDLRDLKDVDEKHLAPLIKAMGGQYAVTPEGKDDARVPYDNDEAVWSMELFHKIDHFDFTYTDPRKNASHNKEEEKEAILIHALENVGEDKQDDAIKHFVKTQCQQALSARHAQEWESMVRVTQPLAQPAPKPPTEPAPSPPVQPAPKPPVPGASQAAGFRVLQPDTITARRDSGASAQPSPAKAAKIEADFRRHLKASFPQSKWKHEQTPTRTTLTEITEPTHQIQIDTIADGLQFKATGGAMDKIADAANAYQKALAENNETVDYEVEAASEQACKDFVKKLKSDGLDISLINTVKYQGTVLKGEAVKSWIASVTAPRPRP